MLIQAEKEFCCCYKARVSNCSFRGKIKNKTLCCPQQPTGFPGSSEVKNQPARTGDSGDSGSISGWERPPGGANGNPLQYSCLENPRDEEAWWAAVSGVAQSRTGLKRLSSSSSSMPFIPTSNKEDLMYPLAKEAGTPTQASLRHIFLVTLSY